MTQDAILFPMLTLVGWTMSVLLLAPFRRFQAAFAGQLTADDFKLGESARVPAVVSIPNRNFMNLLEVPVFFYVLCITLFVTQRVDSLMVSLAWTYVGLRVVHSLIHLSYNHVIQRMLAYAFSNLVLSATWFITLYRLING